MEMPFSQRMGFNPVKSSIQIDSMDEALRVGIWNSLATIVWKYMKTDKDVLEGEPSKQLIDAIWVEFLKQTFDTSPGQYLSVAPGYINKFYSKFEWYEIYDFIEFVANKHPNASISED